MSAYGGGGARWRLDGEALRRGRQRLCGRGHAEEEGEAEPGSQSVCSEAAMRCDNRGVVCRLRSCHPGRMKRRRRRGAKHGVGGKEERRVRGVLALTELRRAVRRWELPRSRGRGRGAGRRRRGEREMKKRGDGERGGRRGGTMICGAHVSPAIFLYYFCV